MTSLFPPKESLVVTSRLGMGNSRTFFYGELLIAHSRKGLAHSPIAGFTCTTDSLQKPTYLLTLIRMTKDEKGLAFFKGLLL